MSPDADTNADELRDEYRLDYSKARPNRFTQTIEEGSIVVILEPDIAQVFTTPEAVKKVLRAIIETMPKANV
jgi:hypothetical protein